MKRALLIALMLCLAGCASQPSGRGSRLLPWNWFSADNATRLENAQGDTDLAEAAQVKLAQESVRATGQALAAESNPSLPVQVAQQFNARADASLAQAVGPITSAEDRALAQMVAQLTSENAELRAKGAADLARRDRQEATLSREIENLRQREKEVAGKLIESDRQYQAQAEKYRRLWFWIYAVAATWIALQILSGLARFYPGLAPIARVAGMVSAPLVQAAYNRATTAVGRALADTEAISKDAAAVLRQHLDTNTDTPEQIAIKSGYNTAPRT